MLIAYTFYLQVSLPSPSHADRSVTPKAPPPPATPVPKKKLKSLPKGFCKCSSRGSCRGASVLAWAREESATHFASVNLTVRTLICYHLMCILNAMNAQKGKHV